MAEGVGFEPTELTPASFQDWCLKPDSANPLWRGERDLNSRDVERPNALAERPLKPNLSISPLVGEVGLAPTVFLRHGFTVRSLRRWGTPR